MSRPGYDFEMLVVSYSLGSIMRILSAWCFSEKTICAQTMWEAETLKTVAIIMLNRLFSVSPASQSQNNVHVTVVMSKSIHHGLLLSFFQQELPKNLFLVAACNPHRSCSGAIRSHGGATERDWRLQVGYYYVKEVYPTMNYLKWDYGALEAGQEQEYLQELLRTKMRMVVEEGERRREQSEHSAQGHGGAAGPAILPE